MTTFQVRDLRNGDWYWIHKEVLKKLSQFPENTLKVYSWLATFVDNTAQKCFPSIELLIKNCNISKSSCIRALKNLEKIGVVAVERKSGKGNLYSLLKPVDFGTSSQIDTGSQIDTPPVSNQLPELYSSNYTHSLVSKDTKGVTSVSEVKIKEEPNTKNQTEAQKRLLKHFGTKWQEKFGNRYSPVFARDFAIAKRLLRLHPEELLYHCINFFFRLSDDPFLEKGGYSPPSFAGKLNAILTNTEFRRNEDRRRTEKILQEAQN